MRDFLFRRFRPSYWFMSDPYNADWDAFILDAIAGDKFSEIGEHRAKVGNVEVWLKGHPYSSFTAHGLAIKARPSCRTIELAHKYLVTKVISGGK